METDACNFQHPPEAEARFFIASVSTRLQQWTPFTCENVALRLVRQPPNHPSATNPRNRSAATGRHRAHGVWLAARSGPAHDRRATLGTCRPDNVRTAYVAVGEAVAARLVVVDAIDDDAAKFYAHHGFIAAPGYPLRLYRQMKDIRASLG